MENRHERRIFGTYERISAFAAMPALAPMLLLALLPVLLLLRSDVAALLLFLPVRVRALLVGMMSLMPLGFRDGRNHQSGDQQYGDDKRMAHHM